MPRIYAMTVKTPTDRMYLRMYQVLHRHFPEIQTQEAMAKKLEIKPTSMANNKAKQRLPRKYVWRVQALTGCREAYVLTGRLPIYEETAYVIELRQARAAAQAELEEVKMVLQVMRDERDEARREVEALRAAQQRPTPGYLLAASPTADEAEVPPLDDPDEFL